METRQYYTWWFVIETYHGNVTILCLQHRSLHFVCKDRMNEAVINFS